LTSLANDSVSTLIIGFDQETIKFVLELELLEIVGRDSDRKRRSVPAWRIVDFGGPCKLMIGRALEICLTLTSILSRKQERK